MTFTSLNPHDPSDVIGEWDPVAGEDVGATIDRAKAAAREWAAAPAATRSRALSDSAGALAFRAGEVTELT
ncbi:MAG TPA: aldehyde dehydrogenase family protein, partial [Streptosporangiaceae bacterium]